ncbi:RDD family protein [Methylomarinum vadi]|uniref:RDD family protein n=1 Tax=Methylomarinum vadi TaxID=438855 RepID=UPI001362828B|nr:RDD family protein [Methylomarinum vadi]
MSEQIAVSQKQSASFGHIKLRSPDSVHYELEIAGIGARSHAFVIDWHIRLLLAVAWLIALGYILSLWQNLTLSNWKNLATLSLMLWWAPAAIIFFFYHPILEIVMSGRTPGKRMAGVRLVTLNGQTPGAGAILLRNVFRLLDSLPGFYGIGLACVALTRNQVRIGDLAAGLVLVYDDVVSAKTMRKATNLALHSTLKPDEQTLLIDLLERWPQLNIGVRIRLGTQFLERIGQAVPEKAGGRSAYSKEILRLLELMTEEKT